MTKKSERKPARMSRRICFPDDERKLPWLPPLLDSYALVDTGVSIAIRDESRRTNKTLACGRGCCECCRQPDIPVYPHELVGLYWFVSEKLPLPLRTIVREALAGHLPGAPCPFLVEGVCSVHPVRPISCRQFNVFTAPCAPGEDPYYKRHDDVLVPRSDYTDRAFEAVRDHYGLGPCRDAARVDGSIRARIMNLQEYDWRNLATLLEHAGSRGDVEPG